MDEESSQQIIIKKGKKKGDGHHGGAWKVAYADFVTAMMALFIVLWILGQDDKVKEAVSSYFQNPAGYAIGQGHSAIPGRSVNTIKPEILEGFRQLEREKKQLEEMGKELIQKISSSTDFEGLIEQVEIQITEEGLLIEIMETHDDAFFDIGTAKLKPKSEELLIAIGKELSQVNNKIVIEGHTDSRQFPGNGLGYTNYELSADRANAARRALLKGGVDDYQINEIRGYADNRLRNPEDPYSAINRRISIIVKFSFMDNV